MSQNLLALIYSLSYYYFSIQHTCGKPISKSVFYKIYVEDALKDHSPPQKGPSLPWFRKWIQWGTTFASLAGAGKSFFNQV